MLLLIFLFNIIVLLFYLLDFANYTCSLLLFVLCTKFFFFFFAERKVPLIQHGIVGLKGLTIHQAADVGYCDYLLNIKCVALEEVSEIGVYSM